MTGLKRLLPCRRPILIAQDTCYFGDRTEWRYVKASLGCFIAAKGLKNLAQGFNPGNIK
jgi:hypothetical protein